jgi:hypothetical protein
MNAEHHLSLAQQRFAHEHHATPGGHAAGDEHLIFMYRRDHDGTHRWLVNAGGAIFESVLFSENRQMFV